MKIIKIASCLYFAFISASSFAEVTFSYTHKFSPAYLQKLYDGLSEAQSRDPEMQDLISSIPLFDGTAKLPLQGICFPHKPDTDGKGCTVAFIQDPPPANGQLNVTIRKPVEMALLRSKLTEISAAVGSSDPNNTQGHLNFGNVLYAPADDVKGSSDYFCAAEGQAGQMAWQCYLSVRERNQ
ncbi:MAG: hypothetical protein WCO71_04310 [Pseudomonadota bacterium]